MLAVELGEEYFKPEAGVFFVFLSLFFIPSRLYDTLFTTSFRNEDNYKRPTKMSADEIAQGVEQAQEIDPIGTNAVLDENLMASKFLSSA